jgi:hypothetical protein
VARIVVHSMAHRGDVYPYVPIASELCRRGHEVTYVVPREFHPTFAGEPFRCAHSGTDFSPVELDQHGAYIARWGNKLGGGALLPLYFGRFTVPHLDALFEAVDAELAHADLLVSHPAASVIGSMPCELRGLPWVVGGLFPMLVPTATAPPAGMPNLGSTITRATWSVGRSRLAAPLTCRSGFVEFRDRLGLASPRSWNLIDARLSPHRNIALTSSHYIDPAPDWPDGYDLVGFTPRTDPTAGGWTMMCSSSSPPARSRSSSHSAPVVPLRSRISSKPSLTRSASESSRVPPGWCSPTDFGSLQWKRGSTERALLASRFEIVALLAMRRPQRAFDLADPETGSSWRGGTSSNTKHSFAPNTRSRAARPIR